MAGQQLEILGGVMRSEGVLILFVQIAALSRLQNVNRISFEQFAVRPKKNRPYEPTIHEDRSGRLRAMLDTVHRQLDEARLPALLQDRPDRAVQSCRRGSAFSCLLPG